MIIWPLMLLVPGEWLALGVVLLGGGAFLIYIGLRLFISENLTDDYPGQRYITVIGGLSSICIAVGLVLREAEAPIAKQIGPYLPETWRGGMFGWLLFIGGTWLIHMGVRQWSTIDVIPIFPGDKYVGAPLGILMILLGLRLWFK